MVLVTLKRGEKKDADSNPRRETKEKKQPPTPKPRKAAMQPSGGIVVGPGSTVVRNTVHDRVDLGADLFDQRL